MTQRRQLVWQAHGSASATVLPVSRMYCLYCTTPRNCTALHRPHLVQALDVVQEGQGGGGVDPQVILVQADGDVGRTRVRCRGWREREYIGTRG